ncbi:MAG: hypothetical protein ACI4M6_03810 [Christensenellaceae bacterium]
MNNVVKFTISYLVSAVTLLLITLLLGVILSNRYISDTVAKIIMQAVKAVSLTGGLILLSRSDKFLLKSVLFGFLFWLLVVVLTLIVSGIKSFSYVFLLDFLFTVALSAAIALVISLLRK